MSVSAVEVKPKKKRNKILLVLLILLLALLLAVGVYIFTVVRAVNGTEKFEGEALSPSIAANGETIPGTSLEGVDLEEFRSALSISDDAALRDLVESGADTEITNADGSDLADTNASEGDANGNGISDALEGGVATSQPVETGSTDIVLLGSDQRSGAEAAQVSGARADTIMVLHIPEDGSAAYLISIMRDTWVNIPGYGSAKVNAGLNYGGVSLQVATLEQLLGIKMDHVAEIDFQGFKALVDTLGGVTVDVPLAFTASTPGYSFTQGPNQMTGGEALVFVRERYNFSDGDYQRVRNQRAFLRGVYNQMRSEGALSSASKLLPVIESISPYMTVDSGLSAGQIVGIAQPVLSNGNTQLVSMTLPNAGTGWSADGQSIVVLDSQATGALSNALRTNTMGSYISSYGAD
ncbi:LCP family protein [Rothia sp. (in: high G+C Gram-positive bacteria)]|uniref:LCP family protein n=1 Tax=Rothia sp. (in: high G+C Gram-positive bacteria) TaxID=1885016 RepID=UPI000EF01EF9|nr:LytR family transcriptional regulator [Rothia sp. (in: high G+C Gram-positive bacteria)]